MACDTSNDVCLYIDEITYNSVKVHTWEVEESGVHNQGITLYASDGTTVVDTGTTPASGNTYVTFTGLTPNTTYEVVWDNYPATRESFTTLPDNPKVATESQWADLADRVKNAKSLSGSTAPTTSTEGTLGQTYVDTSTGDIYYLSEIDETTSPATYTWVKYATGTTPTVVQTIGTSTTDVMSQKATSELVYKTGGDMTRIQIGQLASATESGNYPIAIGVNATINGIQNNATAIGHFANAGSNFALAIGSGTSSSTSPQAVGVSSIALGTNSYASVGAVAFAYGSATAKGQFDVGTSRGSGAGYGSTEYRLITGVYDGQNNHDAATVAQGNRLMSTAPTSTDAGVVGQLWTDTTTVHTYQLTAIDTTDPDNPSYTWVQRW